VVSKAVILAGGRASHLDASAPPIPKPLLPVNGGTVLDVIVGQLGARGCTDLTLTVGRLAPLIQAVVGERPEATIGYFVEHDPLGTVGALPHIAGLDSTFLMMNGDVLTALDYDDLCACHAADGNTLTLATHRRKLRVDYGVLDVDSSEGAVKRVTGYREKPTIPYTVSMGVYVVEPRAVRHIPRDRSFDIPDLIAALAAAGERVGAYLYDGPWFDLSRPDDLTAAQEQFGRLEALLVPAKRVRPPAGRPFPDVAAPASRRR
jgi:NDP-mannose synthase